MSVLGVARELSAITGIPLKPPKIVLEEGNEDIKSLSSLEVQNKEKCPRYLARIITNIEVKSSPEWLQKD